MSMRCAFYLRWLIIVAPVACSAPMQLRAEERDLPDLPPLPAGELPGLAAKKAQPEILAEFEIEKAGEQIVIPVVMFGKPYRMLLHTSYPGLVLDESLNSQLGRRIGSRKVKLSDSKIKDAHRYLAPRMQIGLVDLPNVLGEDVECIDLSLLRSHYGIEVSGILGMKALRKQIIRIDFDHGKLQFLSRSKPWPGQPLMLNKSGDESPSLILKLPGGAIREFEINSASSCGLVVPADLLEALRKRGSLQDSSTFKQTHFLEDGKPGCQDVDAGVLTELSLAPKLNLRGIKVLGPSERDGTCILGLACLSRFTVVFDFPENLMYLQPGQRFAMADEKDSSGLLIWKPNGNICIRSVRKESAADRAGLKEDDQLLAIDGQTVKKQSLNSLRRALSRTGPTLRLSIQRGNRQIDVSLMFKEPVPDASRSKETPAVPAKKVVPEKELPRNLRVEIPDRLRTFHYLIRAA